MPKTPPSYNRGVQLKLIHGLGILLPGVYLTFTTAYGLSNLLLALCLAFFAFSINTHWSKGALSPTAWLMLGLYALVLVGMAYTPAPWQWSSINLGKYSKIALVVPLMLLFHNRPLLQQRALWAFAAGMVFVLLSTWLNIWFVLPWSASKTPGWGVSHHVMYDHIIQNVMMSFFVVFALVQADAASHPWLRRTWWVLALLAALSITHLSEGRTGLAVLLTALAVYSAVRLGARKTLFALPLGVAILALGVMSSSAMRERIELGVNEFSNSHTDVFSSIGHRLYNWRTTPQLIAEKPVLGHGTGAYHTEICRFMDKPEWCDTFRWHPHNQYLYFAADYGLVGLGLYLALIASLFVAAHRSQDKSARTLLYALASILAVDSLFNSPMFSAKEAEFFLYMMALLVPMCRQAGPADDAGKAP